MTGSNDPRPLRFPLHNAPRVWFLTSGTSPLAIALTRHLHSHGDYVAIGVGAEESEDNGTRGDDLRELLADFGEDGRARVRVVNMDIRNMRQCQSAVAEVVNAWGRVDILLSCTSEAVVGTVEELSTSPETLALVRDQFETNFFGPVNIIKALLPVFRAQRTGHILILTGITGHIGTPGLGMYCASSWALEGFCDSLAYEIAPFNVKMTIVQPNMEVNLLINKLTFTPPMPDYAPENNPAPSAREILTHTLQQGTRDWPEDNDKNGKTQDQATSSSPESTSQRTKRQGQPTKEEESKVNNENKPSSLFPSLTPTAKSALVNETVHALIAVGGHENPPARHIVGHQGVASVKEKLKTVSEELEDFVEVSGAVDIFKGEDGPHVDGSAIRAVGVGQNANR